MSVCVPHMPGACRSQEKVLNPLELGLQMVVSCCVDAETLTQVSAKADCSQWQSHL